MSIRNVKSISSVVSLGEDCSESLEEGLKYVGYALHPAQDYYAHTPDKVHNLKSKVLDEHFVYSSDFPYFVYYPAEYETIKYHLPGNTDNAIKRWEQVKLTKAITISILQAVYDAYPVLFWR